MKLIPFFLVLFNIGLQADSSVCFDKYSSFLSKAPKGWVADFDKAKVLKTCVVYYLKGRTFDNSPAIIYPKLVWMRESGREAVNANIDINTKKLKNRSPGLFVKKRKAIKNSYGLNFDIRHFLGGPKPQEYEAVGYHGTKKGVLLAVYSTRSKKNFVKYLIGFKEFLTTVMPVPRKGIKVLNK